MATIEHTDPPAGVHSLWRLRSYLRPHAPALVIRAVTALGGVGLSIAIPLVTKALIDGPIRHHEVDGVLPLGLLALGLGVLAGSYLYASIFAALSILTSRGLILGLGYALIWEGLLAGLLPGTQIFSVREYVRGIVNVVSPSVVDSIVGTAAVLYAAIALAIFALTFYAAVLYVGG